ncbi:MAG: copper resistance system multicopper oxidase [Gammaproteobacteria bacterium]
MISRRQILRAAPGTAALLGSQGLLPTWAADGLTGKAGNEFELAIQRQTVSIGNRQADIRSINGTLPGPLLRMREGEEVVLRVRNDLDEDTSLHWHGILLPPSMDGVPGISFAGIKPRDTFEYRFRLKQHGTYWYHSHSGFQEQLGVYGPLIIDPADEDKQAGDRELIIVLSDWSFEDPARVWAKLKKQADYYNRRMPTLADLIKRDDQAEWERMRMVRSDIADITGVTYTYLMNGHGPTDDWTGLFRPGERVRLRVINASAMTYFNFRIPGLPLTVIQADGQDLVPLTVDEAQLAVAETMDFLVEPAGDRAYAVIAEAMDRSGMAVGQLTPADGLRAEVPELRSPPQRTMQDMGHGGAHAGMQHEKMNDHANMDHSGHAGMADNTPAPSGTPVDPPPWIPERGPGVMNIVAAPLNRMAEPGTGLSDVDHRVLTYADMQAREAFYDQRKPSREIWLNLTGNMERYMWSFDGKKGTGGTDPIRFRHGERVRLVFINHTMMEHPIHLHGMWMELENGQQPMPRKHTVSVKPAERLSVLVSADAPGDWAFHCHLLLHMKAGMMRTVQIAPPMMEGEDNA